MKARLERVKRDGFVFIEDRKCPQCGAAALCLLPFELMLKQPDGTNIVCHPVLGGCNHGFEAEVRAG